MWSCFFEPKDDLSSTPIPSCQTTSIICPLLRVVGSRPIAPQQSYVTDSHAFLQDRTGQAFQADLYHMLPRPITRDTSRSHSPSYAEDEQGSDSPLLELYSPPGERRMRTPVTSGQEMSGSNRSRIDVIASKKKAYYSYAGDW